MPVGYLNRGSPMTVAIAIGTIINGAIDSVSPAAYTTNFVNRDCLIFLY